MVKLLLEHQADPNIAWGRGTPLNAAIGARQPESEIARLLLEHGADPNAARPLFNAIGNKQAEIAGLLLQHKADVNATIGNGSTPLHIAAKQGSQEIVEMLLANKADPNLRNAEGQTPLDLAKQERERLTPPPGYRPGSSNPELLVKWDEIIRALRDAGALDDLPQLDRIMVSRKSANFSQPVFTRGTNDYNRFSLLELVAVHYGMLSAPDRANPVTPPPMQSGRPPILTFRPIQASRETRRQFPDFAHVTIHRPTPDGLGRTELKVDLEAIIQSGDCAKDVWLEWGDVVEIPEKEHLVSESWTMPEGLVALLKKCLARTVTVKAKAGTSTFDLEPGSGADFSLRPVLLRSHLLATTSDLSRVKVNRHDPVTGEPLEVVLNYENPPSDPDLWLRNGDVIEIPEQP